MSKDIFDRLQKKMGEKKAARAAADASLNDQKFSNLVEKARAEQEAIAKRKAEAAEIKRLEAEKRKAAAAEAGEDIPDDDTSAEEEFIEARPQITIEIYPDNLGAVLEMSKVTLHEVNTYPTRNELILAIADQNITHGVNLTMLDSIVREPHLSKRYIVASGRNFTTGQDGYLKYLVSMPVGLQPKELEDGTVDFKDLGFITVIHKNQVLCHVIPPTRGEDGVDIFGTVLEGQYGKEVEPPLGKNTVLQGGDVVAACDGSLNITRGIISIDEDLRVSGNVNNSTGSIKFPGNIIVTGDVQSGFEVNSGGSITVRGFVEGASIIAANNITLNSMNGMGTGILTAGGNIKGVNIESVTLTAGGDITADVLLNCTIKCDGNLFATGKKGALIGGRATVYGNITAKTVGAPSGNPTNIILGSEFDDLKLMTSLYEKIELLQAEFSKMDNIIKHYTELFKAKRLREEKMDTYKALLLKRKKMSEVFTEASDKYEALKAKYENADNSEGDKNVLTCTQSLNRGVRIRISRAVFETETDTTRCRAYLDDGEIKISY